METERVIQRGQVYYLNMNESVGTEMPIGRPMLVVNNNRSIEEKGVAVCACMTTVPQSGNGVVKVVVNGRNNYVLCHQLMTVDLSRLVNYKGELNSSEMSRVSGNLVWVFGLGIHAAKTCEKEETVVVEKKVDEVTEKFDSELYKRLYEKAVDELIELRFQKDTSVRVEEKIVEVEVEKVVEVEVEKIVEKIVEVPKEVEVEKIVEKIVEVPRELTEDEILEYIDKMFSDDLKVDEVNVDEVIVEDVSVEEPPKKNGRPKTHGMGKSVTREKLNEFKKDGKVNINKDDWWVIAATTGMSQNNARRIVRTRNKIGRFRKIEDLMKVDFVTSSFIDRYRSMLEV